MTGEPDAYQVALPVFEGPLDLLLHLIERQELDITLVSLAQVTGQYLDYLARLPERDPDNLAAFLVIAARLLLIKSRALLPRPPASLVAAEEEDPGEDLVRRLLVYKQFKQAAAWLRELEAAGHQSFVRLAGAPGLARRVDLNDVTLADLVAAVQQVLTVPQPRPSVNGVVSPVTLTVGEQMQHIERALAGGRPLSFFRLLHGSGGRTEVIVTLLAVLELIKQRKIAVRQERPFGDIEILARP